MSNNSLLVNLGFHPCVTWFNILTHLTHMVRTNLVPRKTTMAILVLLTVAMMVQGSVSATSLTKNQNEEVKADIETPQKSQLSKQDEEKDRLIALQFKELEHASSVIRGMKIDLKEQKEFSNQLKNDNGELIAKVMALERKLDALVEKGNKLDTLVNSIF